MAIELTSLPAADEPITLAEAKAHLRIDAADTAEDSAITGFIQAAREYCETYQQRQYLTATRVHQLDRFPMSTRGESRIVLLPYPPLLAITSIVYVDSAGATQTLASGNYLVDAVSQPGRIAPSYSNYWPSTRQQIGAVTITYTCGYGAAADVPQRVKQAMLLGVGSMWENREAGAFMDDNAMAAIHALLGPDRVILEM